MIPRGLRNNNPCNIKRSRTRWLGMSSKQTDSEFVQFQTMAYGYRAVLKIINTYFYKYGLNTIGEIINRWAPSGTDGNDPEGYTFSVLAYINYNYPMAKNLPFNENTTLPPPEKSMYLWLHMLLGMTKFENGFKETEKFGINQLKDDIMTAWCMLYAPPMPTDYEERVLNDLD